VVILIVPANCFPILVACQINLDSGFIFYIETKAGVLISLADLTVSAWFLRVNVNTAPIGATIRNCQRVQVSQHKFAPYSIAHH
jgi:hypothetical protein